MVNPRRLKYCVNNEWHESKTARHMPVTNSRTGEVMAVAPCSTAEEVNSAAGRTYRPFIEEMIIISGRTTYASGDDEAVVMSKR